MAETPFGLRVTVPLDYSQAIERTKTALKDEGFGPVETPRGSMCPDVLTLFSRHLEGEIDPALCATMGRIWRNVLTAAGPTSP